MQKPMIFHPSGNDLKRVMMYYGIELEEKILCPFHEDQNPSCMVNFDEGIFHCFGCSASGDAFHFVQLANPQLNDLQQLILYHAILNSSDVSKITLSTSRKGKSKKKKRKDQMLSLDMASDFYYGLKTVNWNKVKSPYKEYMKKRGFSSQTLNKVKAKLTITNDSYPLIFPVMDLDQFKGYVCRTTNKVIEKKRKYLYNKGFSRIDTLCGRYDSDVVVLCEGYMDHLKFRQFGLTYVAALFGWKITNKQIDKLKAIGVKTIISALDMDTAGRRGNDYLKNFFDVVEFQFPKYKQDDKGNNLLDENGKKIKLKDPGDLTQKQFDIAYRKTKILYRNRRRKQNVSTRSH